VELAEEIGGTPIMFYEFYDYMQQVDILISSISTSSYYLTEDKMKDINTNRGARQLFIIDIAVPRSVDPHLNNINNIHLYNIDSLQSVVNKNILNRKEEGRKGYNLIKQRVALIMEKIGEVDILPTIIQLRREAENIRKESFELSVLSQDLSDKEVDELDSMTKSLVNKIMKQVTKRLNEYVVNIKQ
jgi:glutamyl-tRNA reductase